MSEYILMYTNSSVFILILNAIIHFDDLSLNDALQRLSSENFYILVQIFVCKLFSNGFYINLHLTFSQCLKQMKKNQTIWILSRFRG